MTIISKKTRNQKSYIIEELHDHDILLDTREIFLQSYVDGEEESGIDYRNSVSFLKNIRLLENINKKPIVIHQCTTGGDWDYGMVIFDAIVQCSCAVICIMYGVAASMGSIIPQAADLRLIMPNCCFMVHYGDVYGEGLTVKQARERTKWIDQTSQTMMNIYAEACKEGPFFQVAKSGINNIKTFIKRQLDEKEDWFLTAYEAVEYGFADAIFGSEGYENIEQIKAEYEYGK